MRQTVAAVLLAALLSACAALEVPGGLERAAPRAALRVPFETFTLENGLRVILSEDRTAPVYTLCVVYDVGSRDERPGRTGFAHLFEHMMFQGSANVGKGEHFLLVQNSGGSANGTTNAERTNYFETLPSNQLELGIFLEADRMRALEVTQANFDNQRHAVQEERRLSYDNRPYGRTVEAVHELAYDGFAYKHSTIGSMADLSAATLEEARNFYRSYYAPNNAVLVLVGDFERATALELIRRYFGAIPPHPRPPPPPAIEAEQAAERRRTIVDDFARTPRVDIVYRTVPGNTADWYALRVLGEVLAGDLSSRLYRKLVKELEVAVRVSSGPEEKRGTSLFWISLALRPGRDPEAVERIVYEELERLAREPVEEWELEKVRLRQRRQQAESLYSSRSRALSLGHYAVYYGDPDLINKVSDLLARVGPQDIQRVVTRYFKQNNRSVVWTLPKGGPAASSGG
ncbi:MAG TPA: pitrilysin family protein [candidate division Zixibacteria bacterium]|nr:pitrilysin family protein [candidate division Zixibacteria bacterium]